MRPPVSTSRRRASKMSTPNGLNWLSLETKTPKLPVFIGSGASWVLDWRLTNDPWKYARALSATL